MLAIVARAQTFNVNIADIIYQFPASQTAEMTFVDGGNVLNVLSRSFPLTNVSQIMVSNDDVSSPTISIADEQNSGFESVVDKGISSESYLSLTSGLHLNFQLSGITHVVIESVDAYPIAGDGLLTVEDGKFVEISQPKSIITFSAPDGQTLVAGKDYHIATFPCNLYGGYRLSIYRDGLVAHYFGVHQVAEAGIFDEMQVIVDEMVDNREERLQQQFLRLIDPRDDDNPDDEWCVLRGATGNNPYICYVPTTNAQYKKFLSDHSFESGQDDYPVCNVSYAEAIAYCEWLSNNDSEHDYRLPSEEDWILGAGHMPKDVTMNSNHVEDGLTAVDAYAQTEGACGGIDFWGNC